MPASPSASLSTFGKLPCAQCGASLTAPTWSEYLSDAQARHLWSCDDCGYAFETLVIFATENKSDIAHPLAA
jgi:ribosomal protein L37AE/L43A